MQDFLNNLAQPYWWLSVVLVGILVNVISAPIQRFLGAQIGGFFTFWRIRSECQKAQLLADIGKIVDRPEQQLIVRFEELRYRINCAVLLALSAMAFIWDVILINTPRAANPPIYIVILQFIFPLTGIIALFAAYQEVNKAAYKKQVLTECQRYTDDDIFIHSAISD